ncbi:uncharacterized protein LOC107268357 isoform X2 [Cephus cinctus]|uniref:Uncharacterized protein LOC107268357 isoform X2 n=1 Tax=Cephus cinctus TaxID=211228 RepID=A0AAJ7FKN1_CEPCN|nr:uncharacterized protein LOC107268357 isoform X2 [Cephus cinctus]
MVKQQKHLRDVAEVQKVDISVSGRPRKGGRRKRLVRAQVVRMLSQKQPEVTSGGSGTDAGSVPTPTTSGGAVTPGSYTNGEGSKEFLSTGRTGRRNALPDILGQHADTGTADLPSRLEALTTETKHDQPSTSGLRQEDPSSSQRTG